MVIIPYQMISLISIQIIKQPFKLRNMLIHLLFFLHGEPLSFISIDRLLKPTFQWLCLIDAQDSSRQSPGYVRWRAAAIARWLWEVSLPAGSDFGISWEWNIQYKMEVYTVGGPPTNNYGILAGIQNTDQNCLGIRGQVRISIYVDLLSMRFSFYPKRNLHKQGFQFISICLQFMFLSNPKEI